MCTDTSLRSFNGRRPTVWTRFSRTQAPCDDAMNGEIGAFWPYRLPQAPTSHCTCHLGSKIAAGKVPPYVNAPTGNVFHCLKRYTARRAQTLTAIATGSKGIVLARSFHQLRHDCASLPLPRA